MLHKTLAFVGGQSCTHLLFYGFLQASRALQLLNLNLLEFYSLQSLFKHISYNSHTPPVGGFLPGFIDEETDTHALQEPCSRSPSYQEETQTWSHMLWLHRCRFCNVDFSVCADIVMWEITDILYDLSHSAYLLLTPWICHLPIHSFNHSFDIEISSMQEIVLHPSDIRTTKSLWALPSER